MLPAKASRLAVFVFFLFSLALCVEAQSVASNKTSGTETESAPKTPSSESSAKSETEEVQRLLREQQQELERMRAMLADQSRVINELRERVEHTEQTVAAGVVRTNSIAATDAVTSVASDGAQTGPPKAQASDQDARLSKVEEQSRKNTETITKQLGNISFSGDFRLRYESFYGLLNPTANGDNPAILGNPLSTRQRFRIRARFAIRGQIGKEFDWGLRLASGSFTDAISTNQTLTDFYNRKPFGLDQAYIGWTPAKVPGLRLQAGKFEIPWVRTELTIDNDLQFEGFNETYSRGFKNSKFKNLTLVAWQLPFLERNSAFVRNANGTVNLDESHRAGRDLALYGAQVRGRFEFTPKTALTLAAADLYFSGTQFISPIQVFGPNVQLPVTFTIPATATTPAQTITTQVNIPRELLVAGAGNLGLSTASNNAVNRDGRLSSGYNLIDLIGRLDLSQSAKWPVSLLFNFVTNTQTHDVVVAGPGGANAFLKNNENNGYYAEVIAGRQKERGDLQFIYTFVRLEKDAVLTPFNFSDVFQQSDVRAHRWTFNYMVDPKVFFSFTGIITERPNGLLGVFGSTPPGSLNTPTTRLQFDTNFRF
jgi:hypothetical protein